MPDARRMIFSSESVPSPWAAAGPCIITQGDCLERMDDLAPASVDMVLTDLPYGVTQNEWDKVIDLAAFWRALDRVAKDDAAIVLFGQQPFSSELVCSNPRGFRYEWVWKKPRPSGHLDANRRPLRAHESILVFYKKQPTYNPQMRPGEPYIATGGHPSTNYGKYSDHVTVNGGGRYPVTVLEYKQEQHLHPTQKPVDLLEYFIRTYTNPGDVVLDPCMGSGSTGVACIRSNRAFVGVELTDQFYEVARQRLAVESAQESLFVEQLEGWQVNDSIR